MKKLHLILFLFVIFASCQKEQATIEIHVWYFVNGDPYRDIKALYAVYPGTVIIKDYKQAISIFASDSIIPLVYGAIDNDGQAFENNIEPGSYSVLVLSGFYDQWKVFNETIQPGDSTFILAVFLE